MIHTVLPPCHVTVRIKLGSVLVHTVAKISLIRNSRIRQHFNVDTQDCVDAFNTGVNNCNNAINETYGVLWMV